MIEKMITKGEGTAPAKPRQKKKNYLFSLRPELFEIAPRPATGGKRSPMCGKENFWLVYKERDRAGAQEKGREEEREDSQKKRSFLGLSLSLAPLRPFLFLLVPLKRKKEKKDNSCRLIFLLRSMEVARAKRMSAAAVAAAR